MQNFLRGVFRDAVYPKDIWHGDATYPRIFCEGVPKIGGIEYPMTPGIFCLSLHDYTDCWNTSSKVIVGNGRLKVTGYRFVNN